MAHKYRTRPDQGRVGGNLLPRVLPAPHSSEALQVQHLSRRYSLTAAMAHVVAGLLFADARP